MSLRILFSSGPGDWEDYQPWLAPAMAEAGIAAQIVTSANDPATIDFVIWSPASPLQDFSPFTSLQAVFSLWAGVERVVANQTLRVPLCRLVDPDLTAGMVEWVTGQVLRYHLGLDKYICGSGRVWRQHGYPPLARERLVGIIGLGALGQACAAALTGLGFSVHGWSRSAKGMAQVTCHSGETGLHDVLAACEILVLLLPLTPQTEDLFNRAMFARMRRGVCLINAGRGKLIDDEALLAALAAGQIGHATLDVFRTEPLPASHPFWTHPQITVSPHVAATTRPASAARTIAQNLRGFLDGKPLQNVVDFAAGY